MSSLRSAVASVIRLVAVGLLLLGVVFMVLAYAGDREGMNTIWQWILGMAGFLAGVLLLVFSSMIARFLTRDYE